MCKSKIDKITYSNGSLVQRITLVKMNSCEGFIVSLTLSWWRPLSYRSQSIDLQSKSKDWFLYDNGLRHGSVKFNDSMTGSVYFRTLLWIHFKYSQTYFKNLAVFFNIYLMHESFKDPYIEWERSAITVILHGISIPPGISSDLI